MLNVTHFPGRPALSKRVELYASLTLLALEACAFEASDASRSGTLTKKQTQLFALMLLVGAPLIVSLLSGYFLPGLREVLPAPQQSGPPAYMQSIPDPAASLPPAQPNPPPSQPAQGGPLAGGNYTPVPVLDPSGMAISGSDPVPAAAMAGDGSAVAQGNPQPRPLTAEEIQAINDVH